MVAKGDVLRNGGVEAVAVGDVEVGEVVLAVELDYIHVGGWR